MQHNIFHFKRHKHKFKLKSARICHVIIERTLEKKICEKKPREQRRHHRLKIDLMGSIIRNMNGVPMLRFFLLFPLFHLRDRFNARKCLSRQISFVRAHLFCSHKEDDARLCRLFRFPTLQPHQLYIHTADILPLEAITLKLACSSKNVKTQMKG